MSMHSSDFPVHAAHLLLAGLVAIGAGASAVHAETPVSPGVNLEYRNPDVARWRGVFERPGREVFDQRFRIVQAARVYPGMTVADIGAGTGLFTMLFARAVTPAGKVYAVDIAEGFVADIDERAAEYRVKNVEAIVSDPKDARLPADGIDLVFLCDTYHHFEYPQAMLESISRALRRDGELVVIDYRRIPGQSSPWVMSHVRAGQEEVIGEILAAGFDLAEELDFLRENYFLRFRKRADEKRAD